jgi:valyl-tRNA synthetase
VDKKYKHRELEEKIYKRWEESGHFTPKIDKKKKPYTILLPPPNANAPLHAGHAMYVVEDILCRYHRMVGEPTLFLPGTDHAGIETQFVFEKELAKKGKSRFNYDRKTLYKMISNYVEKNRGIATKQLRQLGFSLDWTRERYTLDKDITKTVVATFYKLHKDGLLYRDASLVNYCTSCGTGFSNLEVNHIEKTDPLYYMKYGPFTLATVRPETKFGDTAIAVYPGDKRYEKWVGKEVEVEGLIGKFNIKIIADEAVNPEFGTGVVKVTPAHDPNDFEIGKRHNLEVKQVIDLDGKLNEKAGKYKGLTVLEARKKVAKDLEDKDLLVKIDKKYKHTIGVCYRCKTVIEPMLIPQWYIKVKPLIKPVISAVKKNKVKLFPPRFKKELLRWLETAPDWNVSRQIVWGIRIPAWKCEACDEWTITDGKTPRQCTRCKNSKLTQDPDTFDTWFSSGHWPLTTLGYPNGRDFKYFYPTTVLDTLWDILPFWVMRMLIFGIYLTSDVPFEWVHLHARVVDSKGKKMSKSKGNVVNPSDLIEKYGADALRFAIVFGIAPAADVPIGDEKLKGMRNFANKIWNIGRFINLQIVKMKNKSVVMPFMASEIKHAMNRITTKEDKQILKELSKLIKSTTKHLDSYRFSAAAEELYDFTWKRLANEYMEKIKDRLRNNDETALNTLIYAYATTLKLLHPFIPFVTEAVWSNLFPDEKPLIISKWPNV